MGTAVKKIILGEDSHIFIAFLTRGDLRREFRQLPSSEVSMHHFRPSSVTRKSINKCHTILFRDNDVTYWLKTKYNI